MTIYSLDIPLQVLIRLFFPPISDRRSCKAVCIGCWSSPTSPLHAAYSVKYCHLLVFWTRVYRQGALVDQTTVASIKGHWRPGLMLSLVKTWNWSKCWSLKSGKDKTHYHSAHLFLSGISLISCHACQV